MARPPFVGPMLLLACWTSTFGCGARTPSLPASASPDGGASEKGCSDDSQCPQGFCDSSGECSVIDDSSRFGTVCRRAPVLPSGLVDGKFNACGPYPCVDGRCRSCRSDLDCQLEYGSPQCRRIPGRPGNRCGIYGPDAELPITTPGVVLPYEELRAVVVRTYPHAVDAFTEGLVYDDGWLLESTGLAGSSSLRRIELETGRIDRMVLLPLDVFAEGLAAVGQRLVQLSYQEGRAFLWEKSSFAPQGELAYAGEGWGLCHDGSRFVMSDGTDTLQVRATDSFEVVARVPVRKRGLPLEGLNELECVGGDVFANIHQQRHIARIQLSTGTVTAWIDTGNLLARSDPGADVSRATGSTASPTSRRETASF